MVNIVCSIEADSLTAIRCLAAFLITRSRKKGADDSEKDIPHIMVETQVSVNFLFFFP